MPNAVVASNGRRLDRMAECVHCVCSLPQDVLDVSEGVLV
jgi:hypothetical protein